MQIKPKMKAWLHVGYRPPAPLCGLLRVGYRMGVMVREGIGALWSALVIRPLLQSLVEGGRHVRVERLPYIRGRGRVVLGDSVYLSGKIGVSFLKRGEQLPSLTIGARTFVGHQCNFALSRAISIGSDCMIAAGTKIQDSDGHPLDPELRRSGAKVPEDEIKPVVIGTNVWVAPRCTILKGVTIGDNAVVATGSVVTKDVPANALVAGVPARVVRSDVRNG